jgi:hypothetical protein
MVLHRLAIVLAAALLAFSIAFAAGSIATGGHGGDAAKRVTPFQVPSATVGARTDRDEPRLRLGAGAATGGTEAPPLVEQPTPAPAP